MVHALVQIRIEDFAQFWSEFQARGYVLRQAHGSLGSQVFQDVDDPQRVLLLFQWESRARMDAFFHDPKIRESTARGGVIELLEISFLHKAGELEA